MERTIQRTTKKTPTAAEIGRKGGKARAANQTPAQRSESARNAAIKRWSAAKKKGKK